MIFVIGGSSYIGRKLCAHFSEKGELLAGTYCHSPIVGMLHFDLEHPDLTRLGVELERARYAIICSAIARIDDCKADEEKSHKINVEGTKTLIEQLFKLKIVPVFLSSDQVFDGKKGNYDEHDQRNPCTVYGRQKKMIEDFLLESSEPFLIARLSKVFGLTFKDGTILTSWVEQLQNDEVVYCAEDQILSPTYVGDIIHALDLSLRNGLRGCYNIASPEAFSRFQLATMLKSHLGIKSGEIVSRSIRDFNFLDSRPLNTSLNPGKFIKATDFRFSSMRACIEKLKSSFPNPDQRNFGNHA